ncbi:MAG: glycogen debranching N-terminal domain-containing protein [Nostoc sp.]|uniref:glycogen debranching N-terminal domain-containing protein n=1 Tax=Nostoc sp. TaxID=1180 RepID=UPI002FFBDBDB
MPTKVIVNPNLITINDGSSFLVTGSDGSIDDNQAQGFFVRDTRLISYYEISLNRYQLSLLASSNITHHSALYQFTNPELTTVNGIFPSGSLLVTIRRDIVGGMHEDIEITNHHLEAVEFQLMLAIRSDFADIFEVKAKKILTRGETATTWKDGILSTEYRNGSFVRGIVTETVCASSTARYANGRLMFDVAIAPGKTWHTSINTTALANGEILKPQENSTVSHNTKAGETSDEFLTNATKLRSSNADIQGFYQQAIIDIGALRIEVDDNGHKFWMPAAGIPWFMAVFGRDSIITSLQTMAVYHDFARGTLVRLAQLQATELRFADNKSRFGDRKSYFADNKSYFGDNKSYSGDNKSYFGDCKSRFGDNKSYFGDRKSYFGDCKSYFGDNKSYFGDNKSYSGDNKSYFGDNKSYSTSLLSRIQT